MNSIYISIDVETDGKMPGISSLYSLGAAAFKVCHEMKSAKAVSTFQVNFQTLENGVPDPGTMQWWKSRPKAFEAARKDAKPPGLATRSFRHWALECTPYRFTGKFVMIAYPAAFDASWVYWYMHAFNRSYLPFGQVPNCVDIKTTASEVLGVPYSRSAKKNWPAEWTAGLPRHSHVAWEDAREQGISWLRMKGINIDLQQALDVEHVCPTNLVSE